MLVNWNLLVSAVKLVSFERVTCSFVGVTCSFDAITFRFVIPKWWILQHIYSGKNSVEEGSGGSFANFRNICFDFAYYSYLHSSTNRKLFHAFVYFYNMTFAVWNGSHSDAKIYMLIRMRNPTVLLL